MSFKKITIVGVGLIGGSVGLACKKNGIAESITGFGRTSAHLEKALELGAIDSYELELSQAVNNADLVLLSTPMGTIFEQLPHIIPHLKPGAVLTDVGSTKTRLIEAAEELMPQGVYFVGGHPIAGRESSGVEAALANLFCGAKTILTPTTATNNDALVRVKAFWEQIGSQVVLMDAEQHDRTLAVISHLPHMVAYALVNAVAELDNHDNQLIALSAGGFRDFTRIASSDAVMWRDICLSNSQAIAGVIDRFQQVLDRLKQHIKSGDAQGLQKEFEAARRVKQKL